MLFAPHCAIVLGMISDEQESYYSRNLPRWQAMVENAGGVWEGVQQVLGGLADADVEPYVMFRAPMGKKVFVVHVSEMTPERIRRELGIPEVENESEPDLATKIGNALGAAELLMGRVNDAIPVIRKVLEETTNNGR